VLCSNEFGHGSRLIKVHWRDSWRCCPKRRSPLEQCIERMPCCCSFLCNQRTCKPKYGPESGNDFVQTLTSAPTFLSAVAGSTRLLGLRKLRDNCYTNADVTANVVGANDGTDTMTAQGGSTGTQSTDIDLNKCNKYRQIKGI
jgi:hypothetical protein